MPFSGEVETGYTYDEFGNMVETGNTSFLNENTYTGSVLDDSTGSVYMNSRYYDLSTGRIQILKSKYNK